MSEKATFQQNMMVSVTALLITSIPYCNFSRQIEIDIHILERMRS